MDESIRKKKKVKRVAQIRRMRDGSAVPLLALRMMSSGLGPLKVNGVSTSDNIKVLSIPGRDVVVDGKWEEGRDIKRRAKGEGEACMGDGK